MQRTSYLTSCGTWLIRPFLSFHRRYNNESLPERLMTVVVVSTMTVAVSSGEKSDAAIVDMYHAKNIEAVEALHRKHGEGRVLEIQ